MVQGVLLSGELHDGFYLIKGFDKEESGPPTYFHAEQSAQKYAVELDRVLAELGFARRSVRLVPVCTPRCEGRDDWRGRRKIVGYKNFYFIYVAVAW